MDVMTVRGISSSADQSSHYAILEDVQADCLEGGVIRCDDGSCKDWSAGLLSAPDINQDDVSEAFPTRGGQSMPYVMILDENRRLMKWASIRLDNGGSDDLQNWLLHGPDIHQDDVSGTFPIEEGQGKLYFLILEGNRRLVEGAFIRLDNGDFDAPPQGQMIDHNFKPFVPAESFSMLEANSQFPSLPGEGDTEMIGEGPTHNVDGACASLLSNEGEKCEMS